jgi:hypothetical protein
MFAAIRQGKIKPGSVEEIMKRVKEGALPLLRSIKGFQTYDWVLAEDNSVSIITMFATSSAAEESQQLLLPWIREHLSPFLETMPNAMTGRVVLHEIG